MASLANESQTGQDGTEEIPVVINGRSSVSTLRPRDL